MEKIIINIILLLIAFCNINSQTNTSINRSISFLNKEYAGASPTSVTSIPIAIGAILYILNPLVIYEDKKIYAGLTKELSMGFGKFGEHRFAFEYSFIFSGNASHQTRLSYKFDLLLKKKIEPSHILQGTGVLSAGAGYFTNFSKQGIFPELTFGYSLRNHKILIFPHVKIRHTFMFKKVDSDITDISFGIILGYANPFNDVIIKRDY
jgi:hypothetical protein